MGAGSVRGMGKKNGLSGRSAAVIDRESSAGGVLKERDCPSRHWLLTSVSVSALLIAAFVHSPAEAVGRAGRPTFGGAVGGTASVPTAGPQGSPSAEVGGNHAARAAARAAAIAGLTQSGNALRAQARNAASQIQQLNAQQRLQAMKAAQHRYRAGQALGALQSRAGTPNERSITEDLRRVLDGLLDEYPDAVIETDANTGMVVKVTQNGEDVTGLLPDINGAWINASLPTQEISADGNYTVTVDQLAERAVSTWSRFDIGLNTTLRFDQDASDWSMLVQVDDPSGVPSQILGRIEALGEVMAINRNGIIFTGTSQINTRGLVVSTVNIGESDMTRAERHEYFLNPPDPRRLSFSFGFKLDADGNGSVQNIGNVRTLETDPVEVSRFEVVQNGAIPRYEHVPIGDPINAGAEYREVGILVEEGAVIATPGVSEGSPLGRVVLAAPIVENYGSIVTPDGQAVLAAGRNFTLYNNDLLAEQSGPGTINVPDDPSVRGALIRVGLMDEFGFQLPNLPNNQFLLYPVLSLADDPNSPLAYPGRIYNEGLVSAPRGNVTIVANRFDNAGMMHATTAVNAEGSIRIVGQDVGFFSILNSFSGTFEYDRAAASLNFLDGSIITVLPDDFIAEDGSQRTIPAGSFDDFVQSSVVIELSPGNRVNNAVTQIGPGSTSDGGNTRLNTDVFGVDPSNELTSPVGELAVSFGDVRFQSGSILYVPSGDVQINALVGNNDDVNLALGLNTNDPDETLLIDPTVYIESGAVLDVSGLMGVEASVAQHYITTLPLGLNELADVPQQRDGALLRQSVTIDQRVNDVTEDGRDWQGSPLFDASGFIDAVPLPVEQVMIDGGSLDINGVTVFEAGAEIFAAGGYISFNSAVVGSTYLVDPTNNLVNIADADPQLQYELFDDVYTPVNDRFGEGQSIDGIGLGGTDSILEPGYDHGGHGGEVAFLGLAIVEGDIQAGVFVGPNQRDGSARQGLDTDPPPTRGTVDLATLDFSGLISKEITFQKDPAGAIPTMPTVGDFINVTVSTDALNTSGAGHFKYGQATAPVVDFITVSAPLSVNTGLVAFEPDATLILPPEGSFSLTAEDVVFRSEVVNGQVSAAQIYAPAGTLTFDLIAVPEIPIRLPSRNVGVVPDDLQVESDADRLFAQDLYQNGGVDGDGNEFSGLNENVATFLLEEGALLDVSGRWVNDTGATRDTLVGSDAIDAGSITITTTPVEGSGPVTGVSSTVFEPGSGVNLSSGGYVGTDGQIARDDSGVPLGAGGDLAILLHGENAERPSIVPLDKEFFEDPDNPGSLIAAEERRQQINDEVRLDGAIVATGFQGSGTFRLQAPEILIGQAEDFAELYPNTEFGQVGPGGIPLTTGMEPAVDDSGNPIMSPTGRILVDPDFFGVGFGSYDMTGLLRVDVAPDTDVQLVQPQWQLVAAEEGAQSLTDVAAVGLNTDAQRPSMNLSLTARGWTDHADVAFRLPATPNSSASFPRRLPGFTLRNALILGEGSAITGSPGSRIRVEAEGQLTAYGEFVAPAGDITLVQRGVTINAVDDANPGLRFLYYTFVNDNQNQGTNNFPVDGIALSLAPTFAADVSGAIVSDPLADALTAIVLDGGQITITATTLFGSEGSALIADGVAATVANRQLNDRVQAAQALAPFDLEDFVAIASNAGTISIDTTSFGVFYGTIRAARPTGTQALGGTFLLNATDVQLFEETPPPDTLLLNTNDDGLLAVDPNQLLSLLRDFSGFFALGNNSIQDSGIGSLQIDADRLAVTADLDLSLDRSFIFEQTGTRDPSTPGSITWLPEGEFLSLFPPLSETTFLPELVGGEGTASIEAPYIALAGAQPSDPNSVVLPEEPISGLELTKANPTGEPKAFLNLTGDVIDIASLFELQHVDAVSLTGREAIRFVTSTATNGGLVRQAILGAPGDLQLTSPLVYPETAAQAVIMTSETVTFSYDGAAGAAPLSAGGEMLVSAKTIIHEGVVRAPLGTILMGFEDEEGFLTALGLERPTAGSLFVPTETVEFRDGSVTSTSLVGLQVPYGFTVEQADWFGPDGVLIGAPPEKTVVVLGANQNLSDGAVIDQSGGGEVYAIEFIPGLGGSRDVLTESTTTDPTAEVYAIVPGYTADVFTVAPQDPFFRSGRVAGDDTFVAPDYGQMGRTLTITEDLPGLPIGTYVLLPGRYATLPGAYRVQVVPGQESALVQTVLPQPDGTLIAPGTLGQGPSATGGRTELFAFQSQVVWGGFSEILETDARPFFTAAAEAADRAVPRLPQDAGRVVFQAVDSFVLDADLRFGVQPGGRGGQVDLSFAKIAVVSDDPGTTADDTFRADLTNQDFLVLSPDDVARFNAESVLFGGIRSTGPDGTEIEPVASEIEIRTTSGDPLENLEIIFAATDTVLVGEGSSILGTAGEGAARAPDIGLAGTGALVIASNAERGILASEDAEVSQAGVIDIEADVTLTPIASLLLAADAGTNLDDSAILGGRLIQITADTINFLRDTSNGGPSDGVDIGQSQLLRLTNAEVLTLQAGSAINFFAPLEFSGRLQDVTFDTPALVNEFAAANPVDGVTIASDLVTLTNRSAGPDDTLSTASVDFAVEAETLILGGVGTSLDGFSFEAVVSERVIAGDSPDPGTLLVAGYIDLVTPLVEAGTGANFTLDAAGTDSVLQLLAPSAADGMPTRSAFAGRVNLEASASVRIESTVSAEGGIVTVLARDGDINIVDNGHVDVSGFSRSFVDKVVSADGGTVVLRADTGNVIVDGADVANGERATVDVSGVDEGSAGTLKIMAGDSLVLNNGKSDADAPQYFDGRGTAGDSSSGGSFQLDALGAVELDARPGNATGPLLAPELVAGGFSKALDVRSGQGNLELYTDLVAGTVALSADDNQAQVIVDSRIDVTGPIGGTIELYGRDQVTLLGNAELLAFANAAQPASEITDPAFRHGEVIIGVGPNGRLDLSDGASLDVHRDVDPPQPGEAGGIVHLRIPFVSVYNNQGLDGIIGDNVLAADFGAPTAIVLEPYEQIRVDDTLDEARWDQVFQDFDPNQSPAEFQAFVTKANQVFDTEPLRITPGLELFNDRTTDLGGDIQISASEDFARHRFDLDGDGVGDAPGVLTLRAIGDVTVTASLTDGFTIDDINNDGVLDTDEIVAGELFAISPDGEIPQSWSYRIVAGARLDSADPTAVAPVATFETGALKDRGNVVIGNEPTMTPPTLFTSGANRGRVDAENSTPPLGENVVVRTGTGSIDIGAGGRGMGDRAPTLSERALQAGLRAPEDAAILLTSPSAVVYTAGVHVPDESGFVDDEEIGLFGVNERFGQNVTEQTFADRYNAPARFGALNGDGVTVEGVNPELAGLQSTDPVFPTFGGDIVFEAPNGSIVGQQHYRDVSSRQNVRVFGSFRSSRQVGTLTDINYGSASADTRDFFADVAYLGQLFTPWLWGQGLGSVDSDATGVFGGDGQQSAHWVVTGAFQQGVAALGGGDVTVTAGQDVRNLSFSIVSSFRATGGKTNDPDASGPAELVTYGGGNLTVAAGNNVGSIVTLAEDGRANIKAGGALNASYNHLVAFDTLGGGANARIDPDSREFLPLPSLFFLGNADVDVQARTSIDIGAIATTQDLNRYLARPTTGNSNPRETYDEAPQDGPARGYYSFDPNLELNDSASLQAVAVAGDLVLEPVNLEYLSRYGGGEAPFAQDGTFLTGNDVVSTYVDQLDSGPRTDLPPTTVLASLGGSAELVGGITVSPADVGNLDVLAFSSIYYYQNTQQNLIAQGGEPLPIPASIKFFDAEPAAMVSPINPRLLATADDSALRPIEAGDYVPGVREIDEGYALDQEGSAVYTKSVVRSDPELRAADEEPSRFVALTGDMISGFDPNKPGDPTVATFGAAPLPIYVNEPATMLAGGDILNLSFVGQNNAEDDVTIIQAGGDITFDQGVQNAQRLDQTPVLEPRGGTFVISGPGEFVLAAGGSLDLKPSLQGFTEDFTSVNFRFESLRFEPDTPFSGFLPGGILAVGNRINPFLAEDSADINILFGAQFGLDLGLPDQEVTTVLGTSDALDALLGEPGSAREGGAQALLFETLREATQTGDTAQSFAAIDALFPQSAGYSDNRSASGSQVQTGDFNMINALVRSEFGGEIDILGPGGGALVGPLNTTEGLPPDAIGVLTLRGGAINVFTDDDFNVFASRTGTLQGGDITIVSSFGDIDAGRGRRTDTVFPRLQTLPNDVLGTLVDFGALVTGAGIFTTVSVPGAPVGNVFLGALRGAISAGEAGIRSSGNLFVSAETIINAVNIQVAGETQSAGDAPTVVAPGVLTISATSETQAGTLDALTVAGREDAENANRVASVISVEVLGLTPAGGSGGSIPGADSELDDLMSPDR